MLARAKCYLPFLFFLWSPPPPEKRLPAIVDRAVWEKITKGRAGIKWDNVVKKIRKGLGGDQEEVLSRSLAGTRQK